jgi:hypothetical protein
LPAWPFDGADPPCAAVIHRHQLGPADARRLEEWRARATLLVLCVSPYVRYEELERWSGLFDLVLSEAPAADILPGQLARRLDGTGRRRPAPGAAPFRIEVAAGDNELGRILADACVRAGYSATPIDDQEIGEQPPARRRDRPRPAERVLTVWELPVLEPGWSRRLEWRVRRTGPVIGLAGFADRAIVAQAREAGAVACLDLPCDLDDLVDAVDRTVAATPPDAWPIPARAEPAHVLPPPRRSARRIGKPAAASHWPDRGPLPTIRHDV